MRISLLAACALLSCGTLSAQTFQPDQRVEFGLNGGVSMNSLPKLSNYSGTNRYLSPTYSLRVHYNFNERYQAGIEIGTTTWKTSDNAWHLVGQENQFVGNEKTTFLFAKQAVNITPEFNVLFPIYGNYRIYNKANLYFGIAGGAVFTMNDGKTSTKTAGGVTYTSQYNFEPGTGFTAGVQIGYTHYIVDHFGFNVEFAPRYANVWMTDARYAGGNNHYSLFYYPISVGLHFRI